MHGSRAQPLKGIEISRRISEKLARLPVDLSRDLRADNLPVGAGLPFLGQQLGGGLVKDRLLVLRREIPPGIPHQLPAESRKHTGESKTRLADPPHLRAIPRRAWHCHSQGRDVPITRKQRTSRRPPATPASGLTDDSALSERLINHWAGSGGAP